MDPARPNRWPCLLVYARILSSFCSISAPFERSSAPRPFFFLLFSFFFLSPPKNREIPFNSLLENEPSSPLLYWVLLRQEWRTRAHYLLNFSWLKGLNSIFRFFLEIFYLSFFLSLCFFFFVFILFEEREAFGELLWWSFFYGKMFEKGKSKGVIFLIICLFRFVR